METYSPFSVSMGRALWVIMVVAGPPHRRILDLALSGSVLDATVGLFLVAPDARESEVRANREAGVQPHCRS